MKIFEKLKKDKLAIFSLSVLCIIFLIGIFAPLIAPNDPLAINPDFKYAGPSSRFWLGNDHLGRCIASRMIHAARPSFMLVMITMFLIIFIGMVLGVCAGYFGGITDEIIMRICDIMLSFPSEVMVLAIVGILGVGLYNIIIATIIMKWAWYARFFRVAVVQYTELNYIRYAKSAGFNNFHIIKKHIIPAILPEILLTSSQNIGSLTLFMGGLSFLGLGVQAPNPEWGMMLSEAKDFMLSHPTQMLPAGLSIMLIVCCASFFGDSIRDAMDTKYIRKASWKKKLKKKRI